MHTGRLTLLSVALVLSACADVPPLIPTPGCDVEPCESEPNNDPNNQPNNDPFNNRPNNDPFNNRPDMPITPTNECTLGERDCADAQQFRTCIQDESGGTRWTLPSACRRDVCVGAGKCCENPCPPGEKLCTADGVQTCEMNENGCFEFSPPVECPDGEVCDTTGACVAGCTSSCTNGARECFPEGTPAYRECVEVEPGCFQLDPSERQCPGSEVCRGDGRCEVACTDECPGQENQLFCDVTTEKRCQRAADGCLDWVNTGNQCNIMPNLAGCQSATLGRFVPHATCVQTASDNTVQATCSSSGCKWAICNDGSWSYTCDTRPNGCDTANPHATCM